MKGELSKSPISKDWGVDGAIGKGIKISCINYKIIYEEVWTLLLLQPNQDLIFIQNYFQINELQKVIAF